MSKVVCVICGKVVNERASMSKGSWFKYPVAHEGMVKGQPCHGFYVNGVEHKGEENG